MRFVALDTGRGRHLIVADDLTRAMNYRRAISPYRGAIFTGVC
jgi:hypothetical protein